jgi:hypothetical protein
MQKTQKSEAPMGKHLKHSSSHYIEVTPVRLTQERVSSPCCSIVGQQKPFSGNTHTEGLIVLRPAIYLLMNKVFYLNKFCIEGVQVLLHLGYCSFVSSLATHPWLIAKRRIFSLRCVAAALGKDSGSYFGAFGWVDLYFLGVCVDLAARTLAP